MAEAPLASRSAFTDLRDWKTPQLSVEASEDLTMASVAAAKGAADRLREVVRDVYGVALPERPARVQVQDIAFVWSGVDQWLAVAERGPGRDLELELKPRLAGLATVVDQSDGRAIIRLSGSRARDVLAKSIPIDLHPRAFKPGDAAITHASHIGVMVWQLDEAPTYELAMFRSFADSFVHWLRDAAAEFDPLP